MQPIKTEVFKEQIKEFSIILEYFNGKEELELREDFGFNKILMFNTLIMMDSYAELFFNIKLNEDNRPYAESVSGIANPVTLVTPSMRVEGYLQNDPQKRGNVRIDQSTKFAIWSEYEHFIMRTPNEFDDMRNNSRS